MSESSPLFDAIRELVGSMRVNSHPISQSLKILKAIDAAEAAYESLVDENRILRGLVQTNPDWKCPRGYKTMLDGETLVTCIGHCPLGFPGCACADDRIAVLCEDGSGVISRLRARVEDAEKWRGLSGANSFEEMHATIGLLAESQARVAELENALRPYVLAQSRMLDRWSEGDDNVRARLWADLHLCEENGRKVLDG